MPIAGSVAVSKSVSLFYLDALIPMVGGGVAGVIASLVFAKFAQPTQRPDRCLAGLFTNAFWLIPVFVIAAFLITTALVFKHRSYC